MYTPEDAYTITAFSKMENISKYDGDLDTGGQSDICPDDSSLKVVTPYKLKNVFVYIVIFI